MRIVLVGGGGHASDILGAFEAKIAMLGGGDTGVIGVVADDDVNLARFNGRGVTQLGSIDDLKHVDATHFIAAVGFPEGRRSVAERAMALGLQPVSIIHPRAWVPPGVPVGPGSVILAGVCISPLVVIGCHVYLSHGSLVGHDCQISDYVSVMPGASVSGDTFLGEGCTIGASATVIEKRSVGAWSVIGAGAVVTSNVPDHVTAKGIPARWT